MVKGFSNIDANNDTEILQQAKSQSLDDLVVIINSVTGKFAGS